MRDIELRVLYIYIYIYIYIYMSHFNFMLNMKEITHLPHSEQGMF
jgi:hypothetical protein